MKLTAGLISAIVLFSSAVAEASSLRHSHNHRHKAVRRDAAPVIVKRAVHTVTVTKTKTKTEWVDPPAPTKEPEQKVEELPEEKKGGKKGGKKDEKEPVSGGDECPTGKGLRDEFPDGKCDCSKFPSDYGAVPLPWVNPGSGGWSGLQRHGGNYNDCVDETLCSYACPPGWSKAQWPEDQPASGESHGGLLCKGGKLWLTHKTFKTLCVKGHGGVFVRNKLDKAVAICQTDYPGTENMVVPTFVQPGQTLELSVPVSDNYYHWRGGKTSAQFYVNPAGVPLEEGCIWGKEHGGKGNWSPLIFGASYDAGQTWISVAHNQLNENPSNFNVRIIGQQVSGGCEYNYRSNNFGGRAATRDGCTAAMPNGEAYYELF